MRSIAFKTTAIVALMSSVYAYAQTDADLQYDDTLAQSEATEMASPVSDPQTTDSSEPADTESWQSTEPVDNMPADAIEPAMDAVQDAQPIMDPMVESGADPMADPLGDPINDLVEGDEPVLGDVYDVVAMNGSLSTLTTALEAADLVETLKTGGTFTVFAPSDVGFTALPDGQLSELLEEDNKGTLTSVLTYHVVAGDINLETLTDNIEASEGNYEIETVNGALLTALIAEGNVYLLDNTGTIAKIEQADLGASNGTVHVINSVVSPN